MHRYAICLAGVLLMAGAAWAAPLFHTENIFPLVDKHVHGSSIVECPNGDLLACWFHGSGERTADDVVVNGARRKKGADAWGPMFLMADTPGFPDCNPVLYVDREERLWLFWIAVLAHRWECSMLKYRRAGDYQGDGPPQWSWQDVITLKPGDTFPEILQEKFKELDMGEGMWAEYALPYPRLLVEAAQDPYKRQTGWMTRIHPLALPSGRILLPLYSDGFNVSMVAISDDLGAHWRPSLPMVGAGPIQPTLARKRDGSLVAYLRDSGDEPNRVLVSTSQDDGESWSAAVDTDIPNPGSSLEVIVLADGRWVMICNDTPLGRGRLSAWLSDDEGATWKWKRHIEPADEDGRTFAYPSVIQTRDGNIHMTYSFSARKGGACIRHCVLNAQWVEAGE